MRSLAAAALVLVAMAMAGCSTYQVQAIPRLAAGDAAGHTEVDGIRIGAQPFQHFDSAEKIFSQSPMANGVLPILLVVANSSKGEIELTRMRIELGTSDGKWLEPLDRMSVWSEATTVAPPAFLWLFPTKDARAMACDWAVKCMPDLLVCKPGSTVRVFLYFRVGTPFAENTPEQCALVVQFEHADRSKRQSTKIPLKVNRRKSKPEPDREDEFDFDIH